MSNFNSIICLSILIVILKSMYYIIKLNLDPIERARELLAAGDFLPVQQYYTNQQR